MFSTASDICLTSATDAPACVWISFIWNSNSVAAFLLVLAIVLAVVTIPLAFLGGS